MANDNNQNGTNESCCCLLSPYDENYDSQIFR